MENDKKKRTRRPNGASSIYRSADGRWHGRVTVGVKPDGSPDRRHVERKTEAEVIKAVRKLESDRDAGKVRKAGQRWTVKTWLTHWLENIAAPSVKPNTLSGYRVAVNVHLIPGLGAHRLEKLEPEHLEFFYKVMQEKGSAPATAHQAHRTVRAALTHALRRGHVTRNVAMLAVAPRVTEKEVEPYTVAEVQRLLTEAAKRRNSARWAIALALGLRQGEALGLRWVDVDLTTGMLKVRKARQRPKYAHGCTDPCGRKHAGRCPERRQTNEDTADTKSKAGKRVVGLPDALVGLLKLHREEQERERAAAGPEWRESGWVFASEDGRPLIPRTDWDEWKRLIKAAGLRDARLHDARHTAATVLLLLGVSERAVMGVMGWSSTAMAARYQHMIDPIRRDIANRIGGLLWERPEAAASSAEEAPEKGE
ncbi:site-specific integrase [Kitasatospora purpeofusca]|uniref:tyrosine-type recombinase/integrase n=1 Tax=Kitasatospora purpeofusca TaxID=67352 RepID=UPI002E108989|nr:tyrosine-type recombinase/integrase [Kitasatospora purpeofusca]WSR41707.1 site-specific integrase [Kitasatospora purpeofusca]